MKIGFIGAGKVGFTLGKYFTYNNMKIIGYYSRNVLSAQEAATFTKSNYFKSINELIKLSDTIFITTPDIEIINIWESIKKLSIKNKIICHCSGSLSSEIFSNIEYYNSYGYSIHPMYAFNDKYNSYKNFNEATISIEGSMEKINELVSLFNNLGNNTKVISKNDKSLYHLASVYVSNYVFSLFKIAIDSLKICGFDDEEAFNSLYPLLLNNIKAIGENGIVKSLTGPIERGDTNTIKGHLSCLKDKERELYKSLGEKLIGIAKLKNPERDYSEIIKLLGGGL